MILLGTGGFLRLIGHLDIVEVVLANGVEGVVINTSHNCKKSQASDRVLQQIWSSGSDQRGALTQAAVVVGRVWVGHIEYCKCADAEIRVELNKADRKSVV